MLTFNKFLIIRAGIISIANQKIEKLSIYPHTYHAMRGLIIYPHMTR